MKYAVKMSCGHIETVDLVGKGKRREAKIAYLENNRLCKECFAKKKKEVGLIAYAAPSGNVADGEILIRIWLTGDTYSHKEEAKELEFRWNENCEYTYGEFWNKEIKESAIFEEKEKINNIGGKIKTHQSIEAMKFFKKAKEKLGIETGGDIK